MSKTILGISIMVAGTFLTQYFSESCSAEITNNIPLLVGGVLAWWGRVSKGDVNVFGMKK